MLKKNLEPSIFLSYCSPEDQREIQLKEKVFKILVARQYNVIDSANLRPERFITDKILETINDADAVVVLAFTRNVATTLGGMSKYGTSPWIHIEATVAYFLGKPLLLIGDHRLHRHGVFDQNSFPSSRLFINFEEFTSEAYFDMVHSIELFLQSY